MTIKTSWVTTFTKVINFIDFLEAFLNKIFRFTRDIAQAWPNVTWQAKQPNAKQPDI